MDARDDILLELDQLRVEVQVDGDRANAVDGVSLELRRGQTLALVGESGCGKSLTALAILRLLPRPAVKITAGRIIFDGLDLVGASSSELRAVRGSRIAMIFQEPMTSLNPVFSCGEQIAEVLRLHLHMSRRAAKDRSIELLDEVGIDRPADRAGQMPHELSGGMRQRVMIAMAIAAEPELLLADEPTTALDVTVQAQILDLLDRLAQDRSMATILVTHDLALAADRAERVAVMYAGRIVEDAPTSALFSSPQHPYSLGLLACRPAIDQRRERLPLIEGQVPDLFARPAGCAFHPRCPFVQSGCRAEVPVATATDSSRRVECFEYDAVRARGEWPDA